MEIAQEHISKQGCGLIIILDQDGRGNGHLALMKAARMASEESITQSKAYELLGFRPDARDYTEAADALNELGVSSIELLTNNPDKETGLRKLGISVVAIQPVALDLADFPELKRYYCEKAEEGHNVGARLCPQW
jgi:3,4-dihydroxy 2-butanone 4-phosphate synthase/GTP cyclohydrolase II